MPFTVTHVLAIVPLNYGFRRLRLPALAIGSMIPDLPMFLPISTYAHSHSAIGLFLFCLPMGLIAYYFFERLLKQFAIDLLPNIAAERLQNYRVFCPSFEVRELLLVVLAILIGAVTHVLWDAFSHQSGWMVQRVPLLRMSIDVFAWDVPLYKIIQYASSMIGLPLLAYLSVIALWRQSPRLIDETNILSKKIKFVLLGSLLMAPIILSGYHVTQHQSLYIGVGLTVRQSIGFAIVWLFIGSVFYRWHCAKRPQ